MPNDVSIETVLSPDEFTFLVGIVERGNEGDAPDELLSDECNGAVYALAGETLSESPDGVFEVIAEHEGELRAAIENRTVNRVLMLALKYADACDEPGCVMFLGYLYQTGSGVLQDFGAAADYFERASKLGIAQGAVELGALYAAGRGRPTNDQQAYKLFAQAALTDGVPEAYWRLGDFYREGHFVKRDEAVALRLYDNALAAVGDNPALRAIPAHRLADLLLAGVEGAAEADPATALVLYAQAEAGYYQLIDAGETDLQAALDLAVAGQARAREAIAATRTQAASSGVSEATRNRIAERLASFMDTELDRERATDEGRRWGRPSGPRHFRS